jgi:hypothetical protein
MLGVSVMVGEVVIVGVKYSVGVELAVAVWVAVLVEPGLDVTVGVRLGVGLDVDVGVAVAAVERVHSTPPPKPIASRTRLKPSTIPIRRIVMILTAHPITRKRTLVMATRAAARACRAVG